MWLPWSAAPRILRLGAWLLLVVLVISQAYLLLHEGGHALAAVAVGGRVTTLDARPWSSRPHAAYDLAGVTDGQRAFIAAAGTLLPLAAWLALIVAVPRRLPTLLALVRLFASMGVLGSLAPWLVLPWDAMQASAPGDDVVRFARWSGWPPALTAGLTLVAMVGGFVLLWRRTGGAAQLRALRQARSLDVPPRTIVSTAGMLAAGVALALGLHAALPTGAAHGPNGMPPMPTHAPIAEVTLDGTPFDGAFGGGETDGTLHLVLGFEDVAGGFRIQLIDATGAERGLASFGPDTTMGVASSRPRLELPPGPWELRLIAEETVGRFRVWVVEGR